MRLTFLALVLFLFSAAPAQAAQYSLDGGAHIWFGQQWGQFRAHVGPRWAWSWFSIHPNGALGTSFFNGVNGKPLAVGAYNDFDINIPLELGKSIQFGPGGGLSYYMGLDELEKGPIPQAYLQAGYRWDGNYVGIMGIWGPTYKRPASYPDAFPETVNFTGAGLRFEYEIDRGGN